jgi:hypothetical protein
VSGSRKDKAKVIGTEDDSDDGFAPISPAPASLTSEENNAQVPVSDDDIYESSIPDSVEGFGEVLYCSEDDSRIAQERSDEVEIDPGLDVGLDGDNDFDAGSDNT